MANTQTKARLEVLKTKISISREILDNGFFSPTDLPQVKDFYLKNLNESKEEYLELLREVLVPNKTYVMDLENGILPYDEENNIVPFLHNNMIYGRYESEHEDYLFDINTPFATHKYCEFGETMEDNRAEIIECLYVSQWEFNVNPNGVTIITGRPYDYDGDTIYVIVNKNIFDTDLIANISLSSL